MADKDCAFQAIFKSTVRGVTNTLTFDQPDIDQANLNALQKAVIGSAVAATLDLGSAKAVKS